MTQQKTPGIISLAFGFAFIFLSFHAVELHLGAYFTQENASAVGFISLGLAYLSLFVGNLCSALFLRRWGTRGPMIVSAAAYLVWILAMTSLNPWMIFPVAIFSGFAGSMVWMGMISNVIHLSVGSGNANRIPSNMGLVLASYGIGAGLGLMTMSFLVPRFGLRSSFLILSPFTFAGLLCFIKTCNVTEIAPVNFRAVLASYKNPTTLRLASVSITVFFTQALLLSVVPLEIEKTMGTRNIGWLTSFAFFVLAICHAVGKLTERFGYRKVMVFAYACLTAGLVTLIASSGFWPVIAGVTALCVAFAMLLVTTFTLHYSAPQHKWESTQSAIIGLGDLAIVAALLLSAGLPAYHISLTILYPITLVTAAVSLLAMAPLLKGGKNLEEARRRLALDFPVTAPASMPVEAASARERDLEVRAS